MALYRKPELCWKKSTNQFCWVAMIKLKPAITTVNRSVMHKRFWLHKLIRWKANTQTKKAFCMLHLHRLYTHKLLAGAYITNVWPWLVSHLKWCHNHFCAMVVHTVHCVLVKVDLTEVLHLRKQEKEKLQTKCITSTWILTTTLL